MKFEPVEVTCTKLCACGAPAKWNFKNAYYSLDALVCDGCKKILEEPNRVNTETPNKANSWDDLCLKTGAVIDFNTAVLPSSGTLTLPKIETPQELVVMAECWLSLNKLEREEKRRVMRWLHEVFEI